MNLFIAILLSLTLSPVAAPASLRVQADAQRNGTRITWTPPAGQYMACAFRLQPLPQTPLEPCVFGRTNTIRLYHGGDGNLQVGPGDDVEVRVYAQNGALIAAGGSEVTWRLWFPWVTR